MHVSRSCDVSSGGIADRLPLPRDKDELSRRVAALVYGQLVKAMYESMRDEDGESSVVGDGVNGFLTMYLPGALVRGGVDPVSTWVKRFMMQSEDENGEKVDRTA